jgi:hypothetical protein
MKNELQKPSNLIHIVHTHTLMQFKSWDFILAQTPRDDILAGKTHSISLACILHFLDNTRNHAHLIKLLESMASITTFTVIDKQGNSIKREPFNLFQNAVVKDSIFYYKYPCAIKQYFHAHEPYCLIDLSILRKFDCKYSSFLFQYCLDYLDASITPWLTVEQFYIYMGINEKKYPRGQLKYHVIDKAIKKIGGVTHLRVRAQYKNSQDGTQNICFHIQSSLYSKKKF